MLGNSNKISSEYSQLRKDPGSGPNSHEG
jgi:hypothetical protein